MTVSSSSRQSVACTGFHRKPKQLRDYFAANELSVAAPSIHSVSRTQVVNEFVQALMELSDVAVFRLLSAETQNGAAVPSDPIGGCQSSERVHSASSRLFCYADSGSVRVDLNVSVLRQGVA